MHEFPSMLLVRLDTIGQLLGCASYYSLQVFANVVGTFEASFKMNMLDRFCFPAAANVP